MGEIALLRAFTPGAAGIWVLVGIAVITAIKGWPKLKELQLASDGSLRGDLMGRIASLETRISDLEKMLANEQAKHAGEIQVLRHQLTNETSSLDALLTLLEVNPEKVVQSVTLIKEQRSRNKAAISLEKGAMAGAFMDKGNL